MNLTAHFTLAEMCHSQTADRLAMDNSPSMSITSNLMITAHGLEMIRALLQRPVVVSSGYRSPLVNRAVGGSASSQHCKGQAADITCPGYGPPRSVMEAILRDGSIPYDQLILEYADAGGGWLHVSFTDAPRKQALVIDHEGTRAYT